MTNEIYVCYKYIGAIPNNICLMGVLSMVVIANSSSNPGVTCAPICISSVSSRTVPSSVCVYAQDVGLCGLISATNIHSISGYSQWSCSTGGYTTSTPCLSPVWPGLSCAGINVVSVNLNALGVTGMNVFDVV